jgi:ABC-type transport system involved in multi-copper enzyme maturation permease subunit
MTTLYRWLWYLLPANPVLVRIVHNGSRRWRHQAIRMGYLAALIFLVVLGLLTGQGMGHDISLTELAKSGAQVFKIVGFGQVILICLLAPLFMAGAIAAERQGQTFDILLTTPLSNVQIVLGSLLGRLFFVWALLLSGLPLFSVLLIFGGVPIRSVFVAFGVAGFWALLMGAVAVTLAVLRAGGRKAVFLFVIFVASYLVAAYAIDTLLLRRLLATAGQTTWLTPLHPLLVLEASLNSADYRPPAPETVAHLSGLARMYLTRPFATFVWWTSLASLLLVLLSALQVRRLGQGEAPVIWLKMRRWLRLERGERSRPPREVWHNPIAWREANTRGKLAWSILARWGFVVLGVAGVVVLLSLYHTRSLPTVRDAMGTPLAPHVVFQFCLLTLLLIEVAVIALVAIYMSASCVSREREDGQLDLMLTTPITPRQYIWGKLRGLVSFLAVLLSLPVLTMLIVSGYTLIGTALQWDGAQVSYTSGQSSAKYDLLLPEAPLLLLLILAPFVALCVTLGMSVSLKARGVLSAVTQGLGFLALHVAFGAACGWSAAKSIPLVGSVLNAFSPVTSIMMLVNPWENLYGFLGDPGFGRASLIVAAVAAAAGYGFIIYGLIVAMVNGFDQAVRQLSGEST